MFSYVMTPNVENTTPHNLIPEHIPRTLIFKTTIELPGMAVKRKYFLTKINMTYNYRKIFPIVMAIN